MPESPLPSRFQKNVCWSALTGLSLTAILVLICVVVWIFGRLFAFLEPVLLPLIVAGIVAYLLDPMVQWMQRRGMSRLWAVIGAMTVTGCAVLGLGAAIVPPLVKQTSELVENRAKIWESATDAAEEFLSSPAIERGVDVLYQNTLRTARAHGLPEEELASMQNKKTAPQQLATVLDANSSRMIDGALAWLMAGGRALSGATATIVGLIMVPVFLFYFLKESDSISRNWHTFLPLRRSRFKFEVVETLKDINSYLISFVRGQMLVSLIDGVLLAIALKIYGLPYAFTIAAAAALLGIIPYLGMILTALPAVLIAWFTWHSAADTAIVAGIFLAVSQFDGWIIQPRIVGNRVGLHEMTVMFSVLFWSLVLGGIVGALLAVPLTAAIKVIFRRYVWSNWHGRIGGGESGENDAKPAPATHEPEASTEASTRES